MSNPDGHLPSESELRAPKALTDDLGALFGGAPAVPPDVDEAVLAMARQRLRRRRWARHVLRWAAVAAAAAVIVLAWTATVSERDAAQPAASALRQAETGPRPATRDPRLSSPHPRPLTPNPQPPLVAPKTLSVAPPRLEGDINGDGRVDILDAFALARQVETDRALRAEWDVNHDGVVDRRDAEALAHAAVKLATHPPQARRLPGG